MTISVAESGLTQAQYNAIKNAKYAPSFRVTASRAGFAFSQYSWPVQRIDRIVDTAPFGTGIMMVRGSDYSGTYGPNVYSVTSNGATTSYAENMQHPSHPYNETPLKISLTTHADANGYPVIWGSNGFGVWASAYEGGFYTNLANSVVLDNTINTTSYLGQNYFVGGTASASASSDYGEDDYIPDRAFDGSHATIWQTPFGTATGWLQYQRTEYPLVSSTGNYTYYVGSFTNTTACPKNWTLQASADGVSWTTLDTVTNNATGNFSKTIAVVNISQYLYFRLNITAVVSGTYIIVTEFRLYPNNTRSTCVDIAPIDGPAYECYAVLQTGTNLFKLVHYYQDPVTRVTTKTVIDDCAYFMPPEGIDVIRTPDYDLVVMSQRRYGGHFLSTSGSTPIRNHYNKQGIYAHKIYGPNEGLAPYGISDAISIDVVERETATSYRKEPRISYQNGVMVVTAQTGNDGYYTRRYYTSKDGRFWSKGFAFPQGNGYNGIGDKIVDNGFYTFTADGSTVRVGPVSPITESPLVPESDITNYITNYSTSHSGIFSANIELDNADGTFDNHLVVNPDTTIQLKHYAGYIVDGERVEYLVAISEVDSITYSETVPERRVSLVSRDRLAWLQDKYRAEVPTYWSTLQGGADDFSPRDDTGYGGLAHIARQKGSFRAPGNPPLEAFDYDNLAFITYKSDVMDGFLETRFVIGPTYASVRMPFRAIDTGNQYEVYYQNGGEITLRRLFGPDNSVSTLWSTATSGLSWHPGNGIATGFLRVRFNHQRIQVFYSDDGASWTKAIDYEEDPVEVFYGQPYSWDRYNFQTQHGFCGIGYTYSYIDVTWTGPPPASFYYVEMGDRTVPFTREDLFRAYGSYAGIHDFSFDNVIATSSDWVTSIGTSITNNSNDWDQAQWDSAQWT